MSTVYTCIIVIKNIPGVTQAVAQLDLLQQICPGEQEELLVQTSSHTASRLPPGGHCGRAPSGNKMGRLLKTTIARDTSRW